MGLQFSAQDTHHGKLLKNFSEQLLEIMKRYFLVMSSMPVVEFCNKLFNFMVCLSDHG